MNRISLGFWATELDTSLSSSICQPASICRYRARSLSLFRGDKVKTDQFSYLGNRARYEFIELGMSTVLDLSMPSSRPLTFPGGQSKNGYRARWLIELDDLSSSVTYRARWLIELGFSREEKREKWKLKQ